ncbi:tankyrase-2-like [Cyclospora cayetanensis]|uniref:Tankyrase-2-like n=1 Tax=Cyclospora cayetanensis TaxID=88456 RepID=A0A6P6S1R0_9EIME|nr:tankyrase-2-like [Cyclospora cayetanensis]
MTSCDAQEAGRKLIAAARDGKVRDCKELMKLLPSLDFAEPPYFRTALWHAACRGHEEVARLLLDHGASANHQDIRGSTALHEASVHGHRQITELLIERGASVDVPDCVIHESCACYSNGENQVGLTCYHVAAYAASPGLASFLLYRGVYANRFSTQQHSKHLEAMQKRLEQHTATSVSTEKAVQPNEASEEGTCAVSSPHSTSGVGCVIEFNESYNSQQGPMHGDQESAASKLDESMLMGV